MPRGARTPRSRPAVKPKRAESYAHPEATSLLRPDVGTQAQFRKKKPPQRYRYDSSLSPALDWDGQNPAREQGEQQLGVISDQLSAIRTKLAGADNWDSVAGNVSRAEEAAQNLTAMSRPFLNWAGKAERLSFDVPTLPLFVHERLSTKAILETLKGHKRDKQLSMLELFGDPQRPIHDQVLRAYEYPDNWVNRLILGDSLVVMNSLLHYESLGGQVQMIYMDPPYGVEFGSNFQPFVRKRDVLHNRDDEMTREPEMVRAYRDTWEVGLHSYLSYLRDRFVLSRELLRVSGSIFVQIGHNNFHHVRELLDEVFGSENCCSVITFRKKTMPLGSEYFEQTSDYVLWYARSKDHVKTHPVFKRMSVEGDSIWSWLELPDGSRRKMTGDEIRDHSRLPEGARVYRLVSMLPAQYRPKQDFPFELDGKVYDPPRGSCWKTHPEGMTRLAAARRLQPAGATLQYVLFEDDYPYSRLTALWDDTGGASDKVYVVQTSATVIQRCLLASTDPGDLVVDPTCGSGTTPYVAEQWGRRWIAIDTSRVPLALARQRLLTATFAYYALTDVSHGPAGGFVYVRKDNGGIVKHLKLEHIANDELPMEEVLVDRPETDGKITRVTGAFCVEATIPTPVDWEGEEALTPALSQGAREQDRETEQESYGSFVDRMIEVLRKSPVLHVGGGKTVTLRNVRPPAKTLSLSAEAVVVNGNSVGPAVPATPAETEGLQRSAERPAQPALPDSTASRGPDGEGIVSEPSRDDSRWKDGKAVAIVFGPENGAVSEKLVYEAAREAYAKSYTHLYVIGFAIQPNARELIEKCEQVVGVPATYVQATPDLMMGDLLKNMRSSQIFSVCGLPEVRVQSLKSKVQSQKIEYQVELVGLDVFDPTTMEAVHRSGNDVPAWFLDTDYNGLCFHVCQAFFPRTAAWDDLKKALKGEYEDAVWEHLAGTTSAPFEAGEHGEVAVKVIDDRGNELLVVKNLKDAERG
jgi:adenine-specific DNA-methyltransferase